MNITGEIQSGSGGRLHQYERIDDRKAILDQMEKIMISTEMLIFGENLSTIVNCFKRIGRSIPNLETSEQLFSLLNRCQMFGDQALVVSQLLKNFMPFPNSSFSDYGTVRLCHLVEEIQTRLQQRPSACFKLQSTAALINLDLVQMAQQLDSDLKSLVPLKSSKMELLGKILSQSCHLNEAHNSFQKQYENFQSLSHQIEKINSTDVDLLNEIQTILDQRTKLQKGLTSGSIFDNYDLFLTIYSFFAADNSKNFPCDEADEKLFDALENGCKGFQQEANNLRNSFTNSWVVGDERQIDLVDRPELVYSGLNDPMEFDGLIETIHKTRMERKNDCNKLEMALVELKNKNQTFVGMLRVKLNELIKRDPYPAMDIKVQLFNVRKFFEYAQKCRTVEKDFSSLLQELDGQDRFDKASVDNLHRQKLVLIDSACKNRIQNIRCDMEGIKKDAFHLVQKKNQGGRKEHQQILVKKQQREKKQRVIEQADELMFLVVDMNAQETVLSVLEWAINKGHNQNVMVYLERMLALAVQSNYFSTQESLIELEEILQNIKNI